jgi:predicted alpha/beta hydrolase
LAPANAIDALVAQFPATCVTRRHVGGTALGAKGVGHMGFFRASSGAPWWRETVAWLDALA